MVVHVYTLTTMAASTVSRNERLLCERNNFEVFTYMMQASTIADAYVRLERNDGLAAAYSGGHCIPEKLDALSWRLLEVLNTQAEDLNWHLPEAKDIVGDGSFTRARNHIGMVCENKNGNPTEWFHKLKCACDAYLKAFEESKYNQMC